MGERIDWRADGAMLADRTWENEGEQMQADTWTEVPLSDYDLPGAPGDLPPVPFPRTRFEVPPYVDKVVGHEFGGGGPRGWGHGPPVGEDLQAYEEGFRARLTTLVLEAWWRRASPR